MRVQTTASHANTHFSNSVLGDTVGHGQKKSDQTGHLDEIHSSGHQAGRAREALIVPAQPLSSIAPKSAVRIGTSIIWDRPILAHYIAQVVSLASMTDYHWASMLASTGKSDPRAIMAMHGALSSTSAQRAVFKALVALKLPPEHQALIEIIEKASRPARDIRNNFCHKLWGVADDVPDSLILIDPVAYHEMQIGFLENLGGIASSQPMSDMDRSLMYVYRKDDLSEAAHQVGQMLDATVKLRMLLEPSQHVGSYEQRHLALIKSPLVARALQQREQQSQKSRPQ